MNAIHTLAGRPARWLALAALAALLALAAALALNAAPSAEAQTTTNTMQTGMDEDRTNFRLELSLVDDSDGTVPAGSSARLRAVLKFDVPKAKTNGPSFGTDAAAHGDFGQAFTIQDGGTLRIAGPYEWENAGGRTLRIDPNRAGFTGDVDTGAADGSAYSEPFFRTGTGCDVEDWDNALGRVTWPTPTGTLSDPPQAADLTVVNCTDANHQRTPIAPDDWKSYNYSQKGYYGNFGENGADFLDDRDGHQGWCTAATTDEVTTWSCELPLVDDQFGWKGHNNYAAANDNFDNLQGNTWGLIPARRDSNARDGSITIPTGTPDGSFTVSASISFHSAEGLGATALAANTGKVTVTDSLTVNIGTVAEAQSASLDFATQTAGANVMTSQIGSPWPSTVAADGAGTRLSLAVLNANGKASARGSVSAIALRTNFGLLDVDSPISCKGRSAAGLTCEIETANLDTSNYGNIPIKVLPPTNDKAGVATVQGFLLTTAGDSIQLGPVEVTFTGDASTITISEPTSSILNTATSAANDNRDLLTLSVSAVDASDNKADVPDTRRNATLKDPDGKTVGSTAGISAAWLVDADNTPPTPVLDAAGNPQVRITVSAAATAAVKTGVYTLELRAGSLTATQTFTVAGEAAAIDVATSETDYAPNARFTLTATVTNADGAAVPDGTPVVWAEPQPTARLVRISGTTATKGGEASATYVVIGEGRAWITLTSGAGTGFWSENVGTAATPPAAANPADELSARAGFASYLGTADTTASALLGGLGNVTSIRIWQLDRWVLYAVIDGVSPPDAAEDFTVSRGAVLWIGS